MNGPKFFPRTVKESALFWNMKHKSWSTILHTAWPTWCRGRPGWCIVYARRVSVSTHPSWPVLPLVVNIVTKQLCYSKTAFEPVVRIRIRKFWASRMRIQIRVRNNMHGSGSGSGWFHQQPKKFRKTLISTFLWLLNDLLSLKFAVNVPRVRNQQKKRWKKLFFCRHLENH